MANDFYTPSGNPANNSTGSSLTIRAEFTSIQSAFDKLPALSGNANKIVTVNASATALTVSSSITIDGSGNVAIPGTLAVTGATTLAGDLTVDTSTLKVDSTTNRVGIGTASPTAPLHVVGGIYNTGTYKTAGTEGLRIAKDDGYISFFDTADATRQGYLQFLTGQGISLVSDVSGRQLFFATNSGAGAATRWSINAAGTLYPFTHNAHAFGTAASRPSVVYSVLGDFTGLISSATDEALRINNDAAFISGYANPGGYRQGYLQFNAPSNEIILYNDRASGAVKFGVNGGAAYLVFAANYLRPTVDGGLDLGGASNRWAAGWFSGGVTASAFSGNGASLTSLTATNLTGNLAIARFNSGTSASSSTFWRGDGTWASPTATSVANALTAGSYLTSSGTFDGSAARTFAVDATDANTASKVVARDGSGNFAAGTITATLNGSAATLTTPRNINGTAFDGSANITVAAAAGTLTGGTLAAGVTASSLTSVGSGCTDGTYELGYKDMPRQTGGLARGTVYATGSGFTVNSATTGYAYAVYNDSASAITLTQGTATLRLAGTTTTGSRTLAARGLAYLWFNGAAECIVSGNVS